MRHTTKWILIAGLLLPGTLPAEVTNRIVARVNDRILTLHDFERRYQQTLAQVQDIPQEPSEREALQIEVAEQTMRQLWDEMLIFSRAEQKGWTVSESQIQDNIQRMLEANGMTDETEFRAALDQAGVPYDSWREGFESQLRYRMVISREVYQSIDLQDEDVRRYYRSHEKDFEISEQIQVREVVALEAQGTEAMTALAEDALKILRDGGTFESLSGQYPTTALSGIINLGWVEAKDLSAELSVTLAGMAPGEFSDPIPARGGLHIVELVDRRPASTRPFADVEVELRNKLENEAVQEKLVGYLVQLEEDAYIELDPPAIAAGFRTSSGETPLASQFEFLEAEFVDGAILLEEEIIEGELVEAEDAEEAREAGPSEDFNPRGDDNASPPSEDFNARPTEDAEPPSDDSED